MMCVTLALSLDTTSPVTQRSLAPSIRHLAHHKAGGITPCDLLLLQAYRKPAQARAIGISRTLSDRRVREQRAAL